MVVYKARTEPVEIAASPTHVRQVFLNFSQMPEWHTSHFKRIETTPPDRNGLDLKSGDSIRVVMPGMGFGATVSENSPQRFVWEGGLKYVLIGKHSFEFQPSTITPGHTTFVQYEDFTGLVTALNFSGEERQAGAGFDRLNQDLKSRCEGGKGKESD